MHEEHTTLIYFKKNKKTALITAIILFILIIPIAAIGTSKETKLESFLVGSGVFILLFVIMLSLFFYYSITYKKLLNADITPTTIHVNKIFPKINRNKSGSLDFRGISLLTDNGTYHFYHYRKCNITDKDYKEIKPYLEQKNFYANIKVFDKTKIIYQSIDNPLSDIIEKIKCLRS